MFHTYSSTFKQATQLKNQEQVIYLISGGPVKEKSNYQHNYMYFATYFVFLYRKCYSIIYASCGTESMEY